MIASNSEYSNTPFPLIDIVVIIMVSNGCSTFRSGPELAIRFLLELFFWKIKFSMPERIYSEMRAPALAAIHLKNAERGASALYDLKLLQSFWMYRKSRFKKRHIRGSFGLASNLTLANESSKISRGDNTSGEHFKASNVREKSQRFAWCPAISGTRVGFMIRVGS